MGASNSTEVTQVKNTVPVVSQNQKQTVAGGEEDERDVRDLDLNIGKKNRKLAVVLNVVSGRPGAENDTAALRSFFTDQKRVEDGWEFVAPANPSSADMQKTLRTIANGDDDAKLQSLVVFIMCDGKSDGVLIGSQYDTNRHDTVAVQLLLRLFTTSKATENIPKMFFINSCPGTGRDTATAGGALSGRPGHREGKFSFTLKEDFYVCFSQIKDHYSLSDSNTGSFFIQDLVAVWNHHNNFDKYDMDMLVRLVRRRLITRSIRNPQCLDVMMDTLQQKVVGGVYVKDEIPEPALPAMYEITEEDRGVLTDPEKDVMNSLLEHGMPTHQIVQVMSKISPSRAPLFRDFILRRKRAEQAKKRVELEKKIHTKVSLLSVMTKDMKQLNNELEEQPTDHLLLRKKRSLKHYDSTFSDLQNLEKEVSHLQDIHSEFGHEMDEGVLTETADSLNELIADKRHELSVYHKAEAKHQNKDSFEAKQDKKRHDELKEQLQCLEMMRMANMRRQSVVKTPPVAAADV